MPPRAAVSVIATTRRPGANFAHSAAQLPTTLVGATTRNGSASGRSSRGVADQREGLHGLAQAHVVGEDATEAVVVQKREPVEAVLLVGAQGGLQRRRNLAVDDLVTGQQPADGLLPGRRLGGDALPTSCSSFHSEAWNRLSFSVRPGTSSIPLASSISRRSFSNGPDSSAK